VSGELVSVTVELRDGRRFDLTHVPPDEAVAYLIASGIQPQDILRTVHIVRGPVGAEAVQMTRRTTN